MAQWGQGYQYPMQTGYNPQQFQQGFQPSAGIAPQQTGFPGQRPGFQQPQQTGFPGPGSFQQPQQTGFPGQQPLQAQQTGFPGSNFQQRAPPPPVPPIPSQYQQQNAQPSGFLGIQHPPQVNRFMGPSPGMTAPLTAQQTGFQGGMRPLVPQVTGYVDPRLQMMSSTFLPANMSTPYNPAGAPQLQQLQGGFSLQQSFQQHNQAQRGNATPRVPWALSKAEKKSYDQIFRAWDAQGTGFINGQTALEVFGQSGLDKNDLAKIWALADADNRGKLNLAEFHVAMGLIYRRLNGNDIPDELPAELVPPSSKDLDTSVNLLKDILKNDTRAHSPSGLDSGQISRMKGRSFNDTSAPGAGGRQDATVYKHHDESPPGGFYQPRSRHVDRSAVRTTSENENPAADLEDIKRQLENTAKMLDRTAEENASKTAEDEALDREMADLRYRVKRVQEDLEYVARGPRSVSKDEDKRRLERELLKLLHERLPELEKRIQDREERKAREKREWNRERDRRNDRFGRYDDRDDRYSSSRYDRDEDDHDRSYSRGAYDREDRFDRDRERDRDRGRERDFDRDRPYSRNKERDYDRPRTPPAARSPPPPPPPAPSNLISKPPPPAPAPASPAPTLKNMTPEERKAFIQAEAQRRTRERMAALNLTSASAPSPKLDTSVEDRLAQEKKEAEQKARAAERDAEERERIRRERLQEEKALRDGGISPAPPTPAAAPPAAQVPTPKSTLPPPKPKAPAPPPPRKTPSRPPVRIPAPPAPSPPVVVAAPPPPTPQPVRAPPQDDDDEEIRARQAAVRKQRERLQRLRQLEEEEEEARRAEEEYQARRRAAMQSPPAAPTPPVAAPVTPPAPPAPARPAEASPVAPPPPPPAPPVASPATSDKSTNPFSRLLKESPGAATTPSATNSSTNPFFKNQATSSPATAPAAPSPPVPPPSRSPAPPAVKTSYHTAPGDEDDWDEIEEKEVDDSSDDELDSSRDTRNKLAQQLFGSILPPSRPQSAAASSKLAGPSEPSTPIAPAPPPSAPPMTMADSAPAAPPPPPMAPAAPPPPAMAAPAPTGDRGALLGAIQSGPRLRKVQQINDRSASAISGRVLGDSSPPQHISAAPRAPSPPAPAATPRAAPEEHYSPESTPMMPQGSSRSSNRDSVGWFAGLASNGGMASHEQLPSMAEEEETTDTVPHIHVDSAEEHDPLADVDKSTEYHVRSLYPYEGQRPEDLTFAENLILTAHPSKSGGDWWYGTLVRDGKAGFFPHTYVERVVGVKAKALYSYTGNSPEELPFAEGDELSVVDRSDADWWKAEQGGIVFIVPAGYLEVVEVSERLYGRTAVAADGAKYLEPQPPATEFEDTDSESEETSDSEYHSMSESDTEDTDEDQTEEARAEEREARVMERQRVLEAAGFIIKSDVKPPPRPPRFVRSRSHRKRRPPPAVPDRSSIVSLSPPKELPQLPEHEELDNSLRLDDAFERYENYRQSHPTLNRLSLASSDTSVSMASPTLSAIPRSPSAEPEGKTSLHFLSFFGRSRTPGNDGETRTMPTISAPILMKEPSTPTTGEPDGAFGSTWASLVDKSALEGIPTKERRRQEAIFELISTEGAYVRDLQLIVEHFYAKVLSLLDEKAVTVIFANIEDILLTNTEFLSSLEQRQKECRLYIDRIGDLLTTSMSQMGVYMEYCVNQATAIKVLQSLRQSNPDLASQLQRLRDDSTARNLDLSSYLLVPMQRITRYPLLIKQILHYTDAKEDLQPIERALGMAGKVLEHINETIREQEGRERLKTITKDLWIGQGRLDLTAPTRHMGPRRLLKEGLLLKAKSGRRLRAFLCSDILVLTEDGAKSLYRMPIPLSEVQVKEARDELTFQVTIAYPRGGDAVVLRGTSVRDCQDWMKAIDKASRYCREAERMARAR